MKDNIPKITNEELKQANVVADVDNVLKEKLEPEDEQLKEFEEMSIMLGQDNSTDENIMKNYKSYDKNLDEKAS